MYTKMSYILNQTRRWKLQLCLYFYDLLLDNKLCWSKQSDTLVPRLLWRISTARTFTAQKMKFSIKDFCNNCDQIRRKLRIWSHLLKKFLTKNWSFCAVIRARKTKSKFFQVTLNIMKFFYRIFLSLAN